MGRGLAREGGDVSRLGRCGGETRGEWRGGLDRREEDREVGAVEAWVLIGVGAGLLVLWVG